MVQAGRFPLVEQAHDKTRSFAMTLPGYMRTNLSTLLARDGIDRNNWIAVFLMGALPTVGGSAISVILYVSFVWAFVSLALGRFEFRLTHSDRVLAWTFTIFALLVAATAIVGPNTDQVPRKLVWLLGFLAPWVVIPRLRAGSGGNYLLPYITGAAVGVIAGFVVAFFQLIVLKIRPEAVAGNSAVFAIMSLCIMGLGALNLGADSRRRMLLGIGAAVCGTLAVVISLTRGVTMILPFTLLVVLLYTRLSWRSVPSRKIILLAAMTIGLVILGADHALEARMLQTVQDFERIFDGDLTTSTGQRFSLWSAALEAIFRSPLWGYGIQNRMDVLFQSLPDAVNIGTFTHAHNGFLSVALDGGILGLAGLVAMLLVPVAICWHAPQDENYRLRLFMAVSVTGAYALCGLTQIMFKHDIMDSFFIFCSIVLAASIPDVNATQTIVNRAEPLKMSLLPSGKTGRNEDGHPNTKGISI